MLRAEEARAASLFSALRLLNLEPPVGLSQESLTILTKKQRRTIQVPDPVRRSHDAVRLFAVNESEGVCQFVNSHLGGTLIEGIRGHQSSLLSLPKAEEGDYRRPTSQLGLTEDVGEHGNEEIHVHHPQEALMGTAALGKPLEDEGGIVLVAFLVQSKARVGQAGKEVYREVEKGLEVGGDDPHNRISPNTQRNNPDRPVFRIHYQVSAGKALLGSRPRCSPNLVKLLLTQTVSLDLLVEGNPVDLESLCCPAYIPVKFLKYFLEVDDLRLSQGVRSGSRGH
jgi:hypothetical protein